MDKQRFEWKTKQSGIFRQRRYLVVDFYMVVESLTECQLSYTG